MALEVSDVKSPAGDVDGAVWFPALASGDVDTLLTGYIADAAARTDDEDAQAQWVYYRAATAVADRLATTATSKTIALVDQGSKSETVGAGQFGYWSAKAAAYLAAYERIIAALTSVDASPWPAIRSLRGNASVG